MNDSRHFRLSQLAQAATAVAIGVALSGHDVARAAEFLVSSASQITTALATAQPGDTLLMANGTWTNQRISFAANGTAALPITLRAQTPGQVVLNGNSKVNISGSHLVVDGLRFDGGALGAGDHIVEFRGSRGEATNSRLTNSAIIDYNPTNVNIQYPWVSLYGQHNRVDHNRFEGQNHRGVTVVVWRDNAAANNHLIDGNHFVDRPPPINPIDPNGFETIRIGDSSQSLSNSFTTVAGNLFERVDGEIEIISNKSGSNVFQHNTFRESAGTLTLRHGNDNRVEGNFFLGNNKSQSGGVRVIGERQTIVNNYFANVDDRAGGAISISAGVPNSPLSGYYQVKDAVIAHNTLVNITGRAMTFDQDYDAEDQPLLAQNVTVANNIFRNTNQTIFEGNQGTGWTWEGNLAFGAGLGPVSGNPGITVVDPQLQMGADGLWRPAATSPAINAGAGSYSGLIAADMDGQPRDAMFDVGADELSIAGIVRRPLAAADVGPAWLVPTLAASDFNRDGSVDGDDLSTWQGAFGMAAGAAPGDGDGNGDGAVDGADYLQWQRQFGLAAAAAAAAAVPEPATTWLAAAALPPVLAGIVSMPRDSASRRCRLTRTLALGAVRATII